MIKALHIFFTLVLFSNTFRNDHSCRSLFPKNTAYRLFVVSELITK